MKMQFVFFSLVISGNFRLSSRNRLQAYLLAFSKRLFWLLERTTTNHKYQKCRHSSLFCGNNVWAKKCIFSKFDKYNFSVFTQKTFVSSVV